MVRVDPLPVGVDRLDKIRAGNFCGKCSSFLAYLSSDPKKKAIDMAEFQAADRDNNGMMDKQEFIRFILITNGLLSEEYFDDAAAQFDKLALQTEGPKNEIPVEEAFSFYNKMNA